MKCDVLVVGGGLGGCAAALALAEAGRSVVLTEPTDWIGGQVTQQGVPPDENWLIEQGGCTRSYQRYRRAIRDYYRQWFPLNRKAYDDPELNPGGGWVSPIGHLPSVSVAVLESMLAPHRVARRLTLLLHHEAIAADVQGDRVRAVTLRDVRTDVRTYVEAAFVIDATELGDLLPLTRCEYTSGAEGRAAFGEPHAPAEPNPRNVQAVTWCFAVDMIDGHCVIDRPGDYDFWRTYVPPVQPAWPGPQLSWTYSNPRTLQPTRGAMEARGSAQLPPGAVSLWSYRQVLDPKIFDPLAAPHLAHAPHPQHPGITIINWPQNDYVGGSVFDCDDATHHAEQAKRLSLSLFYWLQTEAPRPDGGVGYPGLRLRGDVLGTRDGFAKHPYIRESRRIRARFTVTELHVGREARPGDVEAARFADSVGIGAYHIDLHPSVGGNNYIDLPGYPFQIPLGSLVPVRLQNLVPAAKNIGTSHIANACYRLHPVEWAIGEAAGTLAAECLDGLATPQGVLDTPAALESLQRRLAVRGCPLDWPSARIPRW